MDLSRAEGKHQTLDSATCFHSGLSPSDKDSNLSARNVCAMVGAGAGWLASMMYFYKRVFCFFNRQEKR